MKKKILSMFLAAAMTVSITTSIYAAGETETTEHIQLTDKIFNTTVVSENNGGTSTYGLNNEPTYTVNLELTDGTEEIEDFTITDTEGQSISSQISNTNNSVQISGLVLDELYIFNSTVDGTPIRGAVETLMDGETVVAVTDVYDFSELEAAANNNGASPRSNGSATLQYETSDTTATAPITLVNGSIVRGQLHSTGDYDYYLFTADRNGTIDFKLLVPETYGTYYNIRIYKKVSNYYTSVGGSVNGGTVDEYCRIANVSYGDIYRIEIYPTTSGLTTSYYYLQVENRDSKAWFPQSMGKIITSTIYYWNTNKLTRLSYYYDLTEDPIDFTDEKSGGEDGMSVACALSASAMIFSNMGAKTSNGLYDFRLTDEVADSYLPGTILQTYSDWLTPDPYIAFLVNNNLTGNEVYCTYSDNNGDGIPQAEEYSYLIIGSGYTMGVNSWQSLAEKFGKSEVQYASFAKTQSGFETALENAYLTYPLSSDYGVLVFMQTGTRTHYIVVTKENGEYIVYDPGQKTFYNKELSSYMGATYNFDDIEWFRVFY